MEHPDIPGFHIMSVIGSGGMGTVYNALWLKENYEIALKVLHPHLARLEQFTKRFHKEAALATKLAHPKVARILTSGEQAGFHYIAMELAHGEKLADHLQKGAREVPADTLSISGADPDATILLSRPIAQDNVIKLMRQVTAVLEEARQLGLVHRDIKPDNIIVDEGWNIKLLDFGIAKDKRSLDSVVTLTGQTFGTPRYMSPEQCRGSREIDTRSDLYSLGVVAYQCLCGYTPFPGPTTIAFFNQHMNETPSSLHAVKSNVPRNLSLVVDRLLAKDPSDRHQTPLELQEDLNRVERGEEPLQIYHAKKRGSPAFKYIALFCTVAVILVAVWLLLPYLPIGKKGSPAVEAPPPIPVLQHGDRKTVVQEPVPIAEEKELTAKEEKENEAKILLASAHALFADGDHKQAAAKAAEGERKYADTPLCGKFVSLRQEIERKIEEERIRKTEAERKLEAERIGKAEAEKARVEKEKAEQQRQIAEEAYLKGKEFEKQEEWLLAVARYKEAIPNLSAELKEDAENRITHCQKEHEIVARYEQVQNYLQKGQYTRALELADEIIAGKGTGYKDIAKLHSTARGRLDAERTYKEAQGLQANGYWQKALLKYKDALNRIDPALRAEVEKQIATCSREIEKIEVPYKNAIANAEKAFSEKRYRESIKWYKKALEIRESRELRDRIAEAEALSKQQETVKSLLQQARRALHREDYKRVKRLCNSAFALEPDSMDAKLLLAQASRNLQGEARTERKKQEVKRLIQQAKRAWSNYNDREVKQLCNRVISLDPNNRDAKKMLKWVRGKTTKPPATTEPPKEKPTHRYVGLRFGGVASVSGGDEISSDFSCGSDLSFPLNNTRTMTLALSFGAIMYEDYEEDDVTAYTLSLNFQNSIGGSHFFYSLGWGVTGTLHAAFGYGWQSLFFIYLDDTYFFGELYNEEIENTFSVGLGLRF